MKLITAIFLYNNLRSFRKFKNISFLRQGAVYDIKTNVIVFREEKKRKDTFSSVFFSENGIIKVKIMDKMVSRSKEFQAEPNNVII